MEDKFEPLPKSHYETVKKTLEEHLENEELTPYTRELFKEEVKRINGILRQK